VANNEIQTTAAQLKEHFRNKPGFKNFEVDSAFSSIPRVSFIRVQMWQWSRHLEQLYSSPPHTVLLDVGRGPFSKTHSTYEALTVPTLHKIIWAHRGALSDEDIDFIEHHKEDFARLYD
jgi:hypothetical protein